MIKTIALLVALGLMLSFSDIPAGAETTGGQHRCDKITASAAEAAKKFSVVMPKVPGMEGSAYSDIGCAVRARNEECATRQGLFDSNAHAYDYHSGEEIGVEKAFFVLTADVSTPAGYGIVAFKDRVKADAFAAEHGKAKVLKWYLLVDENLQ
jgi:hypothetical protein